MSLQEELQDVNSALMQLLEQYDAVPLHEDRVQNVQDVRALLSVAMQTAEEEGEDDLLNRIQGLDDDLVEAMNAPDNIMDTLLQNAADTSQDLVDSLGQMGGKRALRKRTLRKRAHRGKTHRGKTHRKRTLRRKRTHRNRK
jgi:hypothetical protein